MTLLKGIWKCLVVVLLAYASAWGYKYMAAQRPDLVLELSVFFIVAGVGAIHLYTQKGE